MATTQPIDTAAGSVADPLVLWREVLDAMGRQDALGYLRVRCPSPLAAEALFSRLAEEQRALHEHLRALPLDEEVRHAIEADLAAFFVALQAQACRWGRVEGEATVIWPWDADRPPERPGLPRRSLAILQDSSRAILGELDLRRLLPLLVQRAAALTQADVAFLALWDPACGTLEVVESHGLGGLCRRRLIMGPVEQSLLLEGDVTHFLGVEDMPWLRDVLGESGLAGALVATLRHQHAPLGVLCCAGRTIGPDGTEETELLSLLADQTAIAMRNAAHYREVVQKAAALHAANDQLRSVDRLKDEFLATVSHELRTPLNFITGFGSILLGEDEGALSEEQRYFVQNMMDGAFQLLALVNDLLDYSRIRSGKLPLNMGRCDVSALLTDAFDLFRFQAAGLQLTLTLSVPDELGMVEGDPQRLSQVIHNMLSNAFKFTPGGGRIALSAKREGDRLRVEVSDTGVGIQPDQIPRLFHRFSQLESGFTRQTGTGLGLAISKSLIDAHGGEIGVTSPAALSPGTGSTFWFTLPCEHAPGPA